MSMQNFSSEFHSPEHFIHDITYGRITDEWMLFHEFEVTQQIFHDKKKLS